jgi:hypothetical protein
MPLVRTPLGLCAPSITESVSSGELMPHHICPVAKQNNCSWVKLLPPIETSLFIPFVMPLKASKAACNAPLSDMFSPNDRVPLAFRPLNSSLLYPARNNMYFFVLFSTENYTKVHH